jgi:catechol 2,3-dioxygenase-like lactoylglutathione lyase family enzyme
MVSWICALPEEHPPQLSLILTQGLPLGSEISGLDHLGFVVATEHDVDEAYRRATEMGVRVTQPRIYAGHYQIFVFDPDGYKIEICTMDKRGEEA